MNDATTPPLTQETLEHVDATPDAGYPLRILRAHRANCDCLYETDGLSKEQTQFWEMMNQWQKERATILDAAIVKLAKT